MMPAITIGDRVRIAGGYEPEPQWLGGRSAVEGTALKWIPGQNNQPALVIALDEPITAKGVTRPSSTATVTGQYLVLELRYVGQTWQEEGTVHLELCDFVPADAPHQDRKVGVWAESHAQYKGLAGSTHHGAL